MFSIVIESVDGQQNFVASKIHIFENMDIVADDKPLSIPLRSRTTIVQQNGSKFTVEGEEVHEIVCYKYGVLDDLPSKAFSKVWNVSHEIHNFPLVLQS